MPDETVTLEYPSIGSLRGIKRPPGVEQYLGIQYAKLTDRFARGALVESHSSPVDATTHGPLPVANPANCDLEQLLIQHTLPHPEYTFSDTECLNLNVSTPSADIRGKVGSSLPVLVFIHGGGFLTGSANWPQWDLGRIVELSVSRGKPIVAVSMNYRLGAFGFMTSPALREAGYLTNNGLHDQKLALSWVQKHIAGFGGDPGAVTVFGCSMGGASGFYHLQSHDPLFHQLAAHGGNGLMRPLPLEVGEMGYGMVVKALGLDSLNPADQVEELLRIPHKELEAKIRDVPAPISAWVDNDVIHAVPTFEGLADPDAVQEIFPGIRSCRTVWMGGCELDGNIFVIASMGRKDDLAESLTRCITTALAVTPDIIPSILSLFNLPGPADSTPEAKALAVATFLTEIGFSGAAKACAQAWQAAEKTAFLTRFACPNPWDGHWKGHATHALDAAFMLQNYNEYLPDGLKLVAESMGRDLVAFVNGESLSGDLALGAKGVPSKSYNADSVDGTARDSAGYKKRDAVRLEKRAAFHELIAGRVEVMDRLMDAVGLFMSGA